jgi:hypothetical protein
MIYYFWYFHNGVVEECVLLGYNAVCPWVSGSGVSEDHHSPAEPILHMTYFEADPKK